MTGNHETCRHCGQRIYWDDYWQTWDHAGRGKSEKLYAELCDPVLGFEKSSFARPGGGK